VPVVSASVPARTRLDFWFDAVILVGYTVAYSYGFTGVVIHEWLGIALGQATVEGWRELLHPSTVTACI
jgi:hypothetical protein